MAKNSAVKSGATLAEKEMKNLLDQLFGCELPMSAPDGRLTFLTFNLKDLEKQFEKK
jgi:DNA mismatch repair protein MutL